MTDQSALFFEPSAEASATDLFRGIGGKRPRHYAAEILEFPPGERAAAIAATPWPTIVADHIASHEMRHGRIERLIDAKARAVAALPTTPQQMTELNRMPVARRQAVADRVEQLTGVRLLSGGEP